MEPKPVVVLVRCADEPLPEFMIHGKVECRWCTALCWLNSENVPRVATFAAWPMCQPCSAALGKLVNERFQP